jgi:hypothetical protein
MTAQDAPFAKASARKLWPSKFGPAIAKKQSPGFTVRESVDTCAVCCVLRTASARAFNILAKSSIESFFINHFLRLQHTPVGDENQGHRNIRLIEKGKIFSK